MKIKAIIWDIGGVLIENPKYKEFWSGISESEKLRIEFGMRKITVKQFIKKGSNLFGISEKEFLKNYKKAYFSGKRNEPAIKLFMKNKLKNYIFSDTNPIHLEYLRIKGKDVFKKADEVFVDKRKKYTKSFREVLKIIKIKPQEAIFIDDKNKYTQIAEKLGIRTILFKNNKQLKKELKTI